MKGYARGQRDAAPGLPTKSLFMDSGKYEPSTLVRGIEFS